MNKHLFLSLLFCIVTLIVNADDNAKWNTLYSYSGDITQMEKIDNYVYCVTDGKLFRYDVNDSTYETYGKIYNQSIVSICAANNLSCLAIGYEDSNLQLLYEDGSSVTISGIKNTQWNVDKVINSISAYGSTIYVSTNFGIVIVDGTNHVIKKSCMLNSKVYSTCEYNGMLYAATSSGVMRASLASNIQDRNNWSSFPISANYPYTNIPFSDTEISKIVLYRGQPHFLVPGKLICVLKADGTFEKAIDWGPTGMSVYGDNLVAYKFNTIYNFSDLYTFTSGFVTLGDIHSIVPLGSGLFWTGCTGSNLSKLQLVLNNANMTVIKQNIFVRGPLSNMPFSMKYDDNSKKLVVTGGGFFWGGYNNSPQLSIYNGTNWDNLNASQINQISGITARDLSALAIDPLNANHYFASGFLDGVFEFDGSKCINFYNETNSTLESTYPTFRYIRVPTMTFDSSGNLWMTDFDVDHTIKLRTKDGTWKEYSFNELNHLVFAMPIFVDSYNHKWVGGSMKKATLFVWDDNGTFDDTSDDVYKYSENFVDQDGNALPILKVNAITQDLDGNIWIGTGIGPFKIYNSSSVGNINMVLNEVKIPRNDGTNFVDILLQNVAINDIAIDGANQKWFATETNGVYLISADGLSTVYHFTMDNSILPSNRVISIAIDKNTGLVYIGTDQGLVVFRSNYGEGKSDFSNVYVYPNPVRPEYLGDITVKGLEYNSSVKITDLNGNIINLGTSSGDTYVWDGKDIRGVRVKTGVYLVFAASEDGSKGVVSKIMVINY